MCTFMNNFGGKPFQFDIYSKLYFGQLPQGDKEFSLIYFIKEGKRIGMRRGR